MHWDGMGNPCGADVRLSPRVCRQPHSQDVCPACRAAVLPAEPEPPNRGPHVAIWKGLSLSQREPPGTPGAACPCLGQLLQCVGSEADPAELLWPGIKQPSKAR